MIFSGMDCSIGLMMFMLRYPSNHKDSCTIPSIHCSNSLILSFFGNSSDNYGDRPVLLIVSQVYCRIASPPLQQHLIANNFANCFWIVTNHMLSLPHMTKSLRRLSKITVLKQDFLFRYCKSNIRRLKFEVLPKWLGHKSPT
jgi:hypothetical protein